MTYLWELLLSRINDMEQRAHCLQKWLDQWKSMLLSKMEYMHKKKYEGEAMKPLQDKNL